MPKVSRITGKAAIAKASKPIITDGQVFSDKFNNRWEDERKRQSQPIQLFKKETSYYKYSK